ncbi:hypothetical protein VTI28DRAFT_7158 [Corynascus sepedonium]
MADYNSMKVPELKKLLGERGLPHTGNKADLIARLTENDKQKAAESAAPQADSKQPPAEDEIDYEDDDLPSTKKDTATEKPAAAASATTETKASDAAPATAAETNTAAGSEAATKPAQEGDKPATEEGSAAAATGQAGGESADDKKPAFSQNLPPTDAKSEAEKRAARAARFGTVTTGGADDSDKQQGQSEETKKAARAARFGLANDAVSALDSALPDRPRKRGRAGEGGGAASGGAGKEDESGRGNKRANRGGGGGAPGGGRNHRRGGRRQGGGGRGQGNNAQKGGGDSKAPARVLDPAEKAKLEARAKRFATNTAAASS